jgi:hypothetical protein
VFVGKGRGAVKEAVKEAVEVRVKVFYVVIF